MLALPNAYSLLEHTAMTAATGYRVPAEIVQALTDREYVRVVGPTGTTWVGTIIGASTDPCMLLKTSDGVQMLPQSFRVERLTKRRVHIWYCNTDQEAGFPAWTWCREIKGNIYDDASSLVHFPSWDTARRAAFAWLAGKPLTWHESADGTRSLICDACDLRVYPDSRRRYFCVGCLRSA
ncbi:hypothetical protein ETD86_40880 [Nonomuraea turkmeniaca]|uniref:Uncharacterized protein n=1 Tax=Nonomuraea turkmeniaca TaxID=103838 RepID=A0A5S4F1X3_9ACTN|nr:hypothetical protein [Nonomuraea turkmeniaca]TMR10082.1 hypothetical protein ETD86_40880 [Nonomuraea turkmeniaca]